MIISAESFNATELGILRCDLGQLGESNTVVSKVKADVVFAHENITQDPHWTPE